MHQDRPLSQLGECELVDVILQGVLRDADESYLIWRTKTHARLCQTCRQRQPRAVAYLSDLVQRLENGLAAELETIRGKHLSRSGAITREALHSLWDRHIGSIDEILLYRAGGPPDEESKLKDDIQSRLIISLAQVGRSIQHLPETIHGEGLVSFRVPVDLCNNEEEFAWRQCAGFIRSLPKECQLFVFSAVLASDICSDFKPDTHSPTVNLGVLYKAVHAAADRFLADYLIANPDVPAEPALTISDISGHVDLAELLREIQQDLYDRTDSLMAGQMEILRRWEREQKRAVDYEPGLIATLGKDLYAQLLEVTKRTLLLAELDFNNTVEPDGYSSVIMYLSAAYEHELKAQIVRPLAQSLIQDGYREYPQGDSRPILRNGVANERLAIGDVLRQLDSDRSLQGRISSQNIDVKRLTGSAGTFKNLRNKWLHPGIVTRQEAEQFRDMIISQSSILRYLFPRGS
jgi:hypothetical protein